MLLLTSNRVFPRKSGLIQQGTPVTCDGCKPQMPGFSREKSSLFRRALRRESRILLKKSRRVGMEGRFLHSETIRRQGG